MIVRLQLGENNLILQPSPLSILALLRTIYKTTNHCSDFMILNFRQREDLKKKGKIIVVIGEATGHFALDVNNKNMGLK